jgi:predicted HTH domain antitoxin
MSLNVVIDFPQDVEERLRRESGSLDADVKEAYALELFRRGKLSHYELSCVLGLDRFETDVFLKRHNVFEGSLTMSDLEADWQTGQRLFRKDR